MENRISGPPLNVPQVIVDGERRLLAVGDGLDQVARPEGHIAAREDARRAGGQGLRIHLDRARPCQLDAVRGVQEAQVGLLADRQNDGVGLHRLVNGLVVHRVKPAVVVVRAAYADQFHSLDASIAADEAARAALRMKMDALAFRFLEFLFALGSPHDRQFSERFQAHHADIGHSGADRGARRIEGRRHVALSRRLAFERRTQRHARRIEGDKTAADDQHPLAQFDFVPVIYVEQEIDGLDHAIQFLAFHRHAAPALRAYTQERTLVTEFAKLTQAELFVERRMEL